jgi:hypothetical protein
MAEIQEISKKAAEFHPKRQIFYYTILQSKSRYFPKRKYRFMHVNNFLISSVMNCNSLQNQKLYKPQANVGTLHSSNVLP